MKLLVRKLNIVNIWKYPLSMYNTFLIGKLLSVQRYIATLTWLLYIKAVFCRVDKVVLTAIWIRTVFSIMLASIIYKQYCKRIVGVLLGLIRNSYYMIPIILLDVVLVLTVALPDNIVLGMIIQVLHLGG